MKLLQGHISYTTTMEVTKKGSSLRELTWTAEREDSLVRCERRERRNRLEDELPTASHTGGQAASIVRRRHPLPVRGGRLDASIRRPSSALEKVGNLIFSDCLELWWWREEARLPESLPREETRGGGGNGRERRSRRLLLRGKRELSR